MKRRTRRKWIGFIAAVALPLAVGGLAGMATAASVTSWYEMLDKPAWTPPGWIFGPVWTLLYLLMGISSWLVWLRPSASSQQRRALALYGIQLLFNGLWSFLFFEFRLTGWALAEILLLAALILWTTLLFFRVRRLAGWLMMPYLLWVIYAVSLNAGIVVLN